jgi:hypothetical protein
MGDAARLTGVLGNVIVSASGNEAKLSAPLAMRFWGDVVPDSGKLLATALPALLVTLASGVTLASTDSISLLGTRSRFIKGGVSGSTLGAMPASLATRESRDGARNISSGCNVASNGSQIGAEVTKASVEGVALGAFSDPALFCSEISRNNAALSISRSASAATASWGNAAWLSTVSEG